MKFVLPDLCDQYGDSLRVLSPMLKNFGGNNCFHGKISTIKCHEDNSFVADAVREEGDGSVLVVDGGGSLRCALLGDNLAAIAASNSWAGIVVFGCVRDVVALKDISIGIQAIAPHPMKSVKRQVGLRDVEVSFGGVSFIPGQYVYADDNGVIVSEDEFTN
jgi:regulator of ribonuclease activity A